MTANYMPSLSHAADLVRVNESFCADAPGSDEEVPFPSKPIEKFRDARIGAFATIVEGQEKRERAVLNFRC